MDALTESVRQAATEAGADLVGFAPTRTVVAVALRHLRGALKAVEDGTYWQAYNCDCYWYLNEVAAPAVLRALCRRLEDHGFTAVPVHNPAWPPVPI